MTISAACFNAVNSEPKEEVSILVCFLESHMIGALSMKMIIPVLDLLDAFCASHFLAAPRFFAPPSSSPPSHYSPG